MSKNNGAAPVQAWRSTFQHGVEVTLPSGLEVRLRPLTLAFLLEGGRLPESLHFFVLGDDSGSLEQMSNKDLLLKQLEFNKLICRHAFAWPVIVDEDEGNHDEMPFYALDPVDINFVVAALDRGVSYLKSFREGQNSGLESFPTGDADTAKAEPDTTLEVITAESSSS